MALLKKIRKIHFAERKTRIKTFYSKLIKAFHRHDLIIS